MTIILDPQSPAEQSGGAAQKDLIKESSTAAFAADVIEASAQVPVIVDFWAPWCGPCKQLGPMLEKLVLQAGGLVRMVKINVDENQDLAAQMQVQSIPAVYAFRDGQPVDGFSGAQPESQIKAFIKRLTGKERPPLEEALEQAKEALENDDPATAGAIFGEILGQDPVNPDAIAGLIRCALAIKDLDQAKRIAEGVDEALKSNPVVAAAISAIELAGEGGTADDMTVLLSRIERNANDHQARFDLANALYGSGKSEDAIDELIELVRRDRTWNDEAARKQLIKIFEALGPVDPLTVDARKRLSSVLFS